MEQQILDLTLEDPKICPQCGTKNAKDSLFCGYAYVTFFMDFFFCLYNF